MRTCARPAMTTFPRSRYHLASATSENRKRGRGVVWGYFPLLFYKLKYILYLGLKTQIPRPKLSL